MQDIAQFSQFLRKKGSKLMKSFFGKKLTEKAQNLCLQCMLIISIEFLEGQMHFISCVNFQPSCCNMLCSRIFILHRLIRDERMTSRVFFPPVEKFTLLKSSRRSWSYIILEMQDFTSFRFIALYEQMHLNNNSLLQMNGDFLEGELHMTSQKNICIQGYNSGDLFEACTGIHVCKQSVNCNFESVNQILSCDP